MKRIIYCLILSLFVASCALAKTWTLGRQANAYSGEQNWITDENGWSVYLSDNSNTSMKNGTIGLIATSRTSSAIRSSGGNGTLDLRDIVILQNGIEYPITNVTLTTLAFSFTSRRSVTNIFINNVSNLGNGVLLAKSYSDSTGCAVKDVRISGTFSVVPDYAFTYASSVTNIMLDSPNLTKIGDKAFFFTRSVTTDLSEIVLPTVRHIGNSAFAADGSGSSGKKNSFRGGVVLDNLDYLGTSAFLQTQYLSHFIAKGGNVEGLATGETGTWVGIFFGCSALNKVEFHCNSLNNIGSKVFNKATAVTECLIGSTNLVTMGGDSGWKGLTSLRFYGAASTTAVDRFLSGISTSAGTKKCTIYVPRDRKFGWKNVANSMTSAELSVAHPENCIGVYRNGSRKAWMVYLSSPLTPKSTVLKVR